MTASLHRLGAGPTAALYYTNDAVHEARPSSRDEYYIADGGGIWWTSGQTVVRTNTAIEAASFRDLCAGLDPGSGKPLVRGAGKGHWAGVDCTMTPGKSVSVLWAAGSPDQRAAIEAAQAVAVERALRFVSEEGLVTVRTGAGGRDKHAADDLIVARFAHFTTREGDPNIHHHCVIINTAKLLLDVRSGRYKALRHLTIDTERLYTFQRAVGAAYRSALAEELSERFGFHFRPAGDQQWEIAGIPQTVLEAFSKRSAQIADLTGPGASPVQREIAALATRQGKDSVPTGVELEARWQRELADLGIDVWASARDPDRTHEPDHRHTKVLGRDRDEHNAGRGLDSDWDIGLDPPEVAGDGPVARAASALLRYESVLTRKSLLQRGLEEAGLSGIGVDAVQAELTALERDGVLIGLTRDPLAREATAAWTTPSIAACEASLLRSANRLDERSWLKTEAIEAALADAPHLSSEQVAAVRHAGNRDGVAIIEAGAGTGKTTAAQAISVAARLSGMSVVGLTPSWVAADELSASAGIPAQAIARWRHDCRHGRTAPLNERTLVLVDEAGMVGTRDLESVLSSAHEAGAKVLLVGDRRQLAAVAGASALRAVSEVVERSAAMEAVRRQVLDWQRAASTLMAQGDSEAGLRAYAVREQVELVSGLQKAQARVISVWREQRAQYGEDVVIVTRRNRDAAALNAMARAVLREEGTLGPDLAALPALDRKGEAVMLAIAIGDRIRFGESLPHLGVRNGNRATVMAVDFAEDGAPRLRLRLDDGRVMDEPWQYLGRPPRFGRKPSLPRLTHALAGTVYAAQARTVQAAVLAITAPTDSREIYVGLTRHRHAVRVVVERTRLDALCRQRQTDPREQPSTSAILERLYKESRQYAEKANVCDYAEDRVAFAETGRLTVSAYQDKLGFSRALQAAKALRVVLARLYPECMIVPLRRILNQSKVRTRPDKIIEPSQASTLADRIKNFITPATQIERCVQDVHHER